MQAHVADVEQARVLGHGPDLPAAHIYVPGGLGLQTVVAGEI